MGTHRLDDCLYSCYSSILFSYSNLRVFGTLMISRGVNTRIVLGEKGQKKAVGPEEGKFDPESIPTKRWSEHEEETMDVWEKQSRCSRHSDESDCSCAKDEQQEENRHHSHSRCSSISSAMHSHYTEDDERDNTCSLYSKCSTQSPHLQSHRRPSGSVASYSNPGHSYNNGSYRNTGSRASGTVPTETYFVGSNFSRAPSTIMGSNSFFTVPSDAVIAQEIEKILDNNDLMELTKKQVRDALSNIFGMDMSCRKGFINQCIDQSLAVRLAQ